MSFLSLILSAVCLNKTAYSSFGINIIIFLSSVNCSLNSFEVILVFLIISCLYFKISVIAYSGE